ncbi:MAG: glycogen debranching protein [Planctomycetota bacterium]|jgi:glycogen operon protein
MASGLPPLSPLPTAQGTRFRIVSHIADHLHLQLYDEMDAPVPARTLTLDAATHRRDGLWEILVPDVGPGQPYTWAVTPDRPLLDPYALAVSGPERFGADAPAAARPPLSEVNRDARFKSVVVAAPPPVAWRRPRTPWERSVIYELHVRGFTRHPSSGVEAPGTFRGLAARADYLRDLGVTAVELLPVHEFDETEVRRLPGLFNFWGYSPVAWFAPNRRYAAAARAPEGPLAEFREMVLALHDAGIEVILDVVFNHTAELDSTGPTWHLRGLDDEVYYLHEPRTGEYVNLTGCGNTVRAQHPTVRALVRDALRWWVHGMGVDGFRFDLAAILARDGDGELMEEPPLIREIETDPALAGVHLVAEAWDAAGGYLVQDWPGGPRWAVWNDRFRDDVRRAWLQQGPCEILADRLTGSVDLFPAGPRRILNYVTAHDGFTLRDAVSFARRHNLANGEKGRDGHAHEVSANLGTEGPSDDPAIRARRDRARRNVVASLLLARGVPMLLAGDELGRTQRGNNNAYCHDSDLTWIDWSGLQTDAAFHRFVRGLIHLRRDAFDVEGEADRLRPDVEASEAFGYRLGRLLVLVNASDGHVSFALPPECAWKVVVNTAQAPPDDLHEPGGAPRWDHDAFAVAGQSLAVLAPA